MKSDLAPRFENRAGRTRGAILNAFVELIFRDGFDNLSVQDIVATAGVARSTFYEHFSSKEDVLRASMSQFFVIFAQSVSCDDQPAELANVVSHFWENRRLVGAIFAPNPRRILALSLSELIEARLRGHAGEGAPLVPYRLVAIQIAEAQLALVESWLRGRAFAHTTEIAVALHQSSRAAAAALVRADPSSEERPLSAADPGGPGIR